MAIAVMGPSAAAQELPSVRTTSSSAVVPFMKTVEASTPLVDEDSAPVELTGHTYVGVSDVDPRDRASGQLGLGLHLAGTVFDHTGLTVSIRHGPVDLLSLLTLLAPDGTTVRIDLMHPRWRITAGDFLSPTDALSGLTVRGDGIMFRYSGRLLGELLAGRPKYFGGGGGHIMRAAIGFAAAPITVRFVATNVLRSPPIASRIRVVSDETVASERDVDDLVRVAQLVPGPSSLRVGGVEVTLRHGTQEVLTRAGFLEARDRMGVPVRGLTGEWRYSLSTKSAALSAYGRRAPGGVGDTHLGGSAASILGSAKVVGPLKFVGRALYSSSPVPYLRHAVVASGGAVGLQYTRARSRMTVQLTSNRLSSTALDRKTETVNVNVAVPFPKVAFDVNLDAGRAIQNGMRRPYRSLRGRIAFFPDAPASFGVSTAYDELGTGPLRRRADADVSWSRGDWSVEAGMGYGSGQVLGDMRHAWGSVEAPLPGALALLVTAEHVRWNPDASPYLRLISPLELGSPWRLTVGVRRPLGLRLPSLKATRQSRGPEP